MMARGVIPLGDKIVQARAARGNMGQKQLAHGARLALRTIQRAEDSKRIDDLTLKRIVSYLERDKSQCEDYLFVYQKLHVEHCEVADGLISTAIRLDKRGESNLAADCVKMVVDSVGEDHACHAKACIYLAMFYDHLDQFAEAASTVQPLIRTREKSGLSDDNYYWALYQRGIARRRMAEHCFGRTWTMTSAVRRLLNNAREDFENVMQSEDERHHVSAKHHLAVLEIHGGHYDKAIEMLNECVSIRRRTESKSKEDAVTRLAYEHRRLGQCHAQLFHRGHRKKSRDDAMRHFSEAEELAAKNERIMREIAIDVMAFGHLS